MGTMDRQRDENNKRRRNRRGTGETADWGSADGTLIQRVIEVVTKSGGAIQFGYTRDGGAYAVRILGDGEPYTDYLRPSDDLAEYLKGVIENYEA